MQIAAPSSPTSVMTETTIPTQPLALGTLCLRTAQGIAASAANEPASAGDRSLLSGAAIARRAAEQLLLATPRTPYHRLDAAAAHAIEGAELLATAARARNAEFPVDVTLATIRDLSRRAFDAFELAFECVEND